MTEDPTAEDRRSMADAGGIAERDLPMGAAEAARNMRLLKAYEVPRIWDVGEQS